jgi:uncharacterized protein YgiM (DUF1202 family)
MKQLAFAATLLAFAACGGGSNPVADVHVDTREPISIAYVTAPELQVHAKAEETAPVIATFQNGEAVSILAKTGDWAEVRTGDRSGWVKASDLGDAAAAKEQNENPQPRFRRMPAPVTNPGAHGEIVLEASVNTDGDVVDVRTLANTTGSESLAAQNAAALSQAKFYPIMHNGEKVPFKYDHHVSY